MNSETGQVYRGLEAILAAEARGEPVVPVSERVAEAVEVGMATLNRRDRRRMASEARRSAKRRQRRP